MGRGIAEWCNVLKNISNVPLKSVFNSASKYFVIFNARSRVRESLRRV